MEVSKWPCRQQKALQENTHLHFVCSGSCLLMWERHANTRNSQLHTQKLEMDPPLTTPPSTDLFTRSTNPSWDPTVRAGERRALAQGNVQGEAPVGGDLNYMGEWEETSSRRDTERKRFHLVGPCWPWHCYKHNGYQKKDKHLQNHAWSVYWQFPSWPFDLNTANTT